MERIRGSIGGIPLELFEQARRSRTCVVSPCGCIYRYDYLGKSWYCAATGPHDARHDEKFGLAIRSVDPIHVSSGHCMADQGRAARLTRW